MCVHTVRCDSPKNTSADTCATTWMNLKNTPLKEARRKKSQFMMSFKGQSPNRQTHRDCAQISGGRGPGAGG